MTPVPITRSQFWLWVDTVVLTLTAPNAVIVYAYGRYSNEHNEAWPARETIAGVLGLSERSVSRALKAAVDADLLTRHQRKRGFLSPMYRRTLPNGVGKQIRQENREDKSVTPRGQICPTERTDLSTKENQGREPGKRTKEDPQSSSTSHTESPMPTPRPSDGGANHEEYEMTDDDRRPSDTDELSGNSGQLPEVHHIANVSTMVSHHMPNAGNMVSASDKMRSELARPVPEFKGCIPTNQTIVMTGWDVLHQVDILKHRAAWNASQGRHWPTKWDAWAHQFLACMTTEQHHEWLSAVLGEANVPNLQWQTTCVIRIMSGEKRKQRGSKGGYGGTP